MPQPRKHVNRPRPRSNGEPAPGNDELGFADRVLGTTGRVLVVFKEGAAREGVRRLHSALGVNVASATDFSSEAQLAMLHEGAILFDDLGVACVAAPDVGLQELAVLEDGPIEAIEPERIVHALQDPDAVALIEAEPMPPVFAPSDGRSLEYWRGYRDGVGLTIGHLIAPPAVGEEVGPVLQAWNETQNTWGLQVTRVHQSARSGRGIRVAVLDTGLDARHPDFLGRQITGQSFIAGQTWADGHSHGTHCIGTSCGPHKPRTLPRYGIAYASGIYAGKVLSNAGRGSDSGILAGMQWALRNRCAVVSMSLGAPVQPGQSFSVAYERVAQRMLAAGVLIVAAAGNDSSRPGTIRPVSHPANCPSIMAVAALDQACRPAVFSNGGINPQGGQVDIAGPGVSVRSSVPRPALYGLKSGTSMATPHVAGIAALWAETGPAVRGHALWTRLVQRAQRLPAPARDVGAGLVQAP